MIRCPGKNGASTSFLPYQAQPKRRLFMGTSTVQQCLICHKDFSAYPSIPRIYCSKSCHVTAQRSGLSLRKISPHRTYACVQCGATVTRTPGKNRKGQRGTQLFCSRICYDAFRRIVVQRREIKCEHCGKKYVPMATPYKRRCCSETCWKAVKKAAPKNCTQCGCLFTPVKLQTQTGKFISNNAGKTCSDFCLQEFYRTNEARKKKISVAFTGDKHPAWKGGISWISNGSYRGSGWQQIAEAARKKSGYRCADCGISQTQADRDLDVHHKIPYFNFVDSHAANKPQNLIVLCHTCHQKAEWKINNKQMVLPFSPSKSGIGHAGYVRGERQHSAKLTEHLVREIRRRIIAGEAQAAMAREYNVSMSSVNALVKRETWKHVI